MNKQDHLYSAPLYYDLAFSDRDIKKNVHFLIKVFKKHCKQDPKSFLELAAGPGRYLLEFARKKIRSLGLDLSKEMQFYALEKARINNLKVHYYLQDMTSFEVNETFDCVGTFLNSLAYILKPDDFLKHLQSVSRSLNPQGIYFLELIHPTEVFESFSKSKHYLKTWTQKKDKLKVDVHWHDHIEDFDYINLISKITLQIKYQNGNQKGVIEDTHLQKIYTFPEITSRISESKLFTLVDAFGDFDLKVSLNHKDAYRMILVLKKI